MELTSNLLQFLVTLLGFCLGAVLYRQNRRQAYFLLACFYGCFARWARFTGLCICCCFQKRRRFFMCRSLGGSQA